MKKRVIIGLVAVFAATALAFGGCGGGDDETTASLTKEQFTKRANALCQKRGEERVAEYRARQAAEANQDREANKDGAGEEDREELFRESFVIPFEEMIGEIEDLGVPKGDEKELEAIFEGWRKGAKVFEKDPLLLLNELPVFDETNKLSTQYGLTGCVF